MWIKQSLMDNILATVFLKVLFLEYFHLQHYVDHPSVEYGSLCKGGPT